MKYFQNESTRVYYINATNLDTAIELAQETAGDDIFNTDNTIQYSDNDEMFPPVPKEGKRPEEPTNTENISKGYTIEITRVGFGTEGGSENASDYFATHMTINDKPFFSPHLEEREHPTPFKVNAVVEGIEENTLFFNEHFIAKEIKANYDCSNTYDDEIKRLIKNNIKHPLITPAMQNDEFLAVFVYTENPNVNNYYNVYHPLMVYNKNTQDIILNDELISTFNYEFEPLVQKITSEITKDLLEEKINTKSKKKTTNKI